jgi:hypothetical protein
MGVFVHDDLLLLVENDVGIHVYELVTPDDPQLRSTLPMPCDATHIAFDGDLAYVADELAGVQVVDLTDPTAPQLIGSFDTPGYSAMQISIGADVVAIADFTGGLHLAWKHCVPTAVPDGVPILTARVAAYPNPFNPQTTVEFVLPVAGRATVDVYDVAGRQLCRLADGVFGAGSHTTVWDGRDAAGRMLPSSTYVLRLSTAAGVQSRKVVMLR